MEQLLLTPSALLSILVQVDELKDKNIQVVETLDGNLQVTIGDSNYEIVEDDLVELEVPGEVVEEVEDLNESTYVDLQECEEVELCDSVEGGILSEIFKTLAVGGLVRLTTKMLTPKEEKLFNKYAEKNMTQKERREAEKSNLYQFRRK